MKLFASFYLLLIISAFQSIPFANAIAKDSVSACSDFWNSLTHTVGSGCKYRAKKNGTKYVVDGVCEIGEKEHIGSLLLGYQLKCVPSYPSVSGFSTITMICVDVSIRWKLKQ
ncbi:hypothetical protein C8R42DRAFT_668584 [Lentinula raphanica]|nr:hypothetical protein C8R42DRAFT_668584 [Lentinula raphanica]